MQTKTLYFKKVVCHIRPKYFTFHCHIPEQELTLSFMTDK